MNLIRQHISKTLKQEGLVFFETNTRMDYGLIGHIKRKNGQLVLLIFEGSFYCSDKDFALNSKTLKLVEDIRQEFLDLTRDEKGKIVIETKGIGDID